MSKTSYLSKGTHVKRLTNYIQLINMSEDDRVFSHKHTTKFFNFLKIPNMDKNLATIIVFDNYNKAIFTKHITNYSFNNDQSGLLMNMTSPSNKHPFYDTW
jgi:hypothetical protein